MKNGEKIETVEGVGYFYNGKLIPEKEYFSKYGKKSGGMTGGCAKCGQGKCMCKGGKMEDGGMAGYKDGGGLGQRIKNAFNALMGREDKGVEQMTKIDPRSTAYASRHSITDRAIIEDTDDKGNTTTTNVAMMPNLESIVRNPGPSEKDLATNQSTGNSAGAFPAPANTYVDEKGLYRIKSGFNKNQIVERNPDGSLTQYIDDNTYNKSRQNKNVPGTIETGIKGAELGNAIGAAAALGTSLKAAKTGVPKKPSTTTSKNPYGVEPGDSPATKWYKEHPDGDIRGWQKEGDKSNKNKSFADSIKTGMYSPEGVKGMKYKQSYKDTIDTHPYGTAQRTAETMASGLGKMLSEDYQVRQRNQEKEFGHINKNKDSLEKASLLYKMGRISKQEFDNIKNKLQQSTDTLNKLSVLNSVGKRFR